MLANTLTITIGGSAKTLTRANQDNFGSEYRLWTATERLTLKIRNSSQTSGGLPYDVHNVVVEHVTYATPTTFEVVLTASTTLRGIRGSSPSSLADLSDGLGVLVASISDAIATGEC